MGAVTALKQHNLGVIVDVAQPASKTCDLEQTNRLGIWIRAIIALKQQVVDVFVYLSQPRVYTCTKSDQNQWHGFRQSTVFSFIQQLVAVIANHDFRTRRFHICLGSPKPYPIIVQKCEVNLTILNFSIIWKLAL